MLFYSGGDHEFQRESFHPILGASAQALLSISLHGDELSKIRNEWEHIVYPRFDSFLCDCVHI